jgi:predicted ATP-grasp superfamily ATP-dependent carboligase
MKILLIGVSVRAMAESAVNSNYAVVALDGFGDRDLRAIAETHGLMRDFHVPYQAQALFDASRHLDFDAVAYTANLENHPEVLDRFVAHRSLIGNLPGAVRSVRCWRDLFSRLQQAGFPVPKTVFNRDHEVDARTGWLVKPVLSGGGHGIHPWDGRALTDTQYMLQQHIPGKACSASFVANRVGACLIGISEQLLGFEQFGVGGFRYCGSIIPLPEVLESETAKVVLEQVRRIAAFLTLEFGLTGVNGFDFILDGERVVLVEVNPRYSASMELLEKAYGLPVFRLHTEAVIDGRLPEFDLESQINRGQFFGKAVLFSEMNCVAPDILNDLGSNLKDIPMPGERLHEGSPICTLLTNKPTYKEILDDLTRRVGMLKRQIYG